MSDDSKNTDNKNSDTQLSENEHDSLNTEGPQNQSAEGSVNAEGSIIDNPDVLASLQQLSMAQADALAQAAGHIHSLETIKNIVEAAIMAASKAVSIDKILTLFPENEAVDKNSIRQAIEQLMQDYQARGIELIEVSSGFRFQVAKKVAPWVSRLWEERPQKYSRALLETLALVAYRQPVTRGEIEEIRGVSVSSQIMRTLVEREWVRVIGHRDVPGKPAMYATTKTFLDYFGLKKLDELPALSEIRDLDVINAELDFGEQTPGDQDPDEPNEGDQNKEYLSLAEAGSDSADESELNITLSVDSEQSENSSDDKIDDESTEGSYDDSTEGSYENSAEGSNEENAPAERIDIDAELNALKETYQQIDAIDKKNEQQEPIDDSEK